MTEHNIVFFLMHTFFFLWFLSLYIHMDLSASPSIWQSFHLSSSLCHFSCHLNHPSIRSSVFQATHSVHPSLSYLSILSFVLWDIVWLPLWSWLLSAEIWWQICSRKPASQWCAHMLSHRQGQTHLYASQHTREHTEWCFFPWPCVAAVFTLPGAALLAWTVGSFSSAVTSVKLISSCLS